MAVLIRHDVCTFLSCCISIIVLMKMPKNLMFFHYLIKIQNSTSRATVLRHVILTAQPTLATLFRDDKGNTKEIKRHDTEIS